MRIPVPILLYHSISDQAAPRFARWAVSPRLFEDQMAYLSEAGYTTKTISEFTSVTADESFNTPARTVVITFDDGFADFYDQAVPVLQKYNLKATIYVATQYIGGVSRWLDHVGEGSREMLSWDQIRSLNDHGIEIGAHSHCHQQLDVLPGAVAKQDILLSKELLEKELSQPVYSFAYPHGYYNQTLRYLVQMAGFTSACAVKHALSSTSDDPFALARLIVSSNSDISAFQQLLDGVNVPVAPYPERVRTKAWRSMRWLLARMNSRTLL